MKDKKFLIAEGSEDCSMLTQTQLENIWVAKENIIVVKNWTEALELVRKELFDIIIISPKLAEIGGIDLANQIKAEQKERSPKIIGSLTSPLEHENPFDATVMKPQITEDLQKEILHVLMMSEKNN